MDYVTTTSESVCIVDIVLGFLYQRRFN